MYIVESKLKMLSPTGRSRMWDADADGYARGEGVAAIVLKRLSDAIADGDHIECLIRETGANQDGFSNGITVPNTEAQTALIRQTYARAGLDPENNPTTIHNSSRRMELALKQEIQRRPPPSMRLLVYTSMPPATLLSMWDPSRPS